MAATEKPAHRAASKARRSRIEDGQEHIKRKLLGELDSITEAMIEKAKAGGTAPLKLLWELGQLHQDATAGGRRRDPSLSGLLMQELRKKQGLEERK